MFYKKVLKPVADLIRHASTHTHVGQQLLALMTFNCSTDIQLLKLKLSLQILL